VVELGGLDRSSGGDLSGEVDALERLITGTSGSPATTPTREEQA
jgi:hypothetical protein